jgi:hypothetical protein
MAIQTLNTIKNWFKTNSKPTQSQFWDTWDSFRHKNEKVSVGDLDGIEELLQDKLEREVFENHLTDPNAHAELIDKKLDNGGYNGTGKNLDDRITAIELPDRVLKFGVLTLSGLNLTITSNAFAWVVNKLQFLTPGSYAKTLTAATSGMYRTDIVVGNQSGAYEVVTGFEAATGTAAVEPPPPTGTIKLGFISLLGNTVVNSGSAPTIEKATIVDADRIVIDDSETSFAKKSVKFLNFKTALKTYFDTIYQSFMGIITMTGTTYQLLLTDNGKKIMCTSATAVAFTIPTNAVVALPIGARIKVTQQGDGVITFTTTGLTIVSSSSLYTIKGQTITLEKTAINTWTIEGNNLNGEIRLAAYPNTRNDGQIPMNRVLGTDANGNLKIFTTPIAPAPFLDELIPDSYLPSTTGNFILKGAFFTPTMTVVVQGQTVNYLTFISDNEIRVNVTTGLTEGNFDVTLNNGLSVTFPGRMLIVLGNVYNFSPSDFPSLTTAISSVDSNLIVSNVSIINQAISSKAFDVTKNWRFSFYAGVSPYFGNLVNGQIPNSGVDAVMNLCFLDVTNNALQMRHVFGGNSTSYLQAGTYVASNTFFFTTTPLFEFWNSHVIIEYRYNVSTRVLSGYLNGVNQTSFTLLVPFPNNLKIQFRTKMLDIFNIKYVETA